MPPPSGIVTTRSRLGSIKNFSFALAAESNKKRWDAVIISASSDDDDDRELSREREREMAKSAMWLGYDHVVVVVFGAT